MKLNSVTLTRKELYDLVWSNSMVTLSKRYATSDNGLRKICNRLNIPLPKGGHWMKLQFNKKVKIMSLPEDANVDQTVSLDLRKEGEPIRSSNPVKELAKEFSFTVPEKLSIPDPLIAVAKERFSGKDVREPHPGIIGCRSDELDIEVAPKYVRRALLFMDALIKALKARHHQIEIQNWKTYVIVKGEKMQIKFREKLKRIVINDRTWGNTALQSTGLLCFRVDGYHGREWTDSKDGVTLLESKLSEIVAWLEIEGQRKADEMAYHRGQWTLREAEEERKKQIVLRREEELGKFRALVAAAERWKQAGMIREYVKAVVGDGVAGAGLVGEVAGLGAAETPSNEPEDIDSWVKWARKKADWVDPVVQGEDGVMGKYGEGN